MWHLWDTTFITKKVPKLNSSVAIIGSPKYALKRKDKGVGDFWAFNEAKIENLQILYCSFNNSKGVEIKKVYNVNSVTQPFKIGVSHWLIEGLSSPILVFSWVQGK
jgi:hypothetical protein